MTTDKNIDAGSAGPLFEDFLKEQGTYEETTEVAIKRVLAFQLAAAMKELHSSHIFLQATELVQELVQV